MIVLDHWVENLRCPNCRKTGAARLSQADGWNARVDIPYQCEVLDSRPPEMIAAAVGRHQIDLIVMGSTGIGTLARLS
jgi:nucleotide-binding universal stress UspA family protein